MEHDITHCIGGYCPLKEKCYRYLAYQEKVDYPVAVVSGIPYDKINNSCDLFFKL